MTSLDRKKYPRDFKSIPIGTDYGSNNELTYNKEEEVWCLLLFWYVIESM
jgi:hypothetical protein